MVTAIASQHWSAPAVPAAVPSLRRSIADFIRDSGVDDRRLGDVQLAITEALSNVVVHSYRDAPEPGPIEVEADLAGSELLVVIADHGGGMAPRVDSPGAGLGLPIIAEIAETMEIRRRDPHGTELRLRFGL